MAGLEEVMRSAAVAAAAMDPGLFESVTYYVDGVTAKTIKAVVSRDDLGPTFEDTMVRTQHAVLRIPADATVGLTVVRPLVDKLDLKLRVGDVAVTSCRVLRIVRQVPGWIAIEVAK